MFGTNNAASITITSDSNPPEFSSAIYSADTGILNVTFNEPLKQAAYDPSKIHIRDINQTTGGISLNASTTVTLSGSTVTAQFNSTISSRISGISTPQLDIESNAVFDAAGNGITQSNDNTIIVADTTTPTFLSATYSAWDGRLIMKFDENLNSTIQKPNIHIRNPGNSTGGVTLGAGDAVSVLGSRVMVTLTAPQRTAVASLTTPQLDIDKGAVFDTFGNGNTESTDNSIQSPAFITTWKTTTDNESITIPVGNYAGNYTVNWGDGNITAAVSGNATHTYTQAGQYDVSISGDFKRIKLGDDASNARKVTALVQWGDISWISMKDAFKFASSMKYSAIDRPDPKRCDRHIVHVPGCRSL